MAEAIGGVTGTLQGYIGNFGGRAQQWLDTLFPPEKRNQFLGFLSQFSTENPKLASFLLSQVSLSGPPLALFLIATISIACFALLVGILLGLLGALAFIVFAAGFALIFLLPALFISIGFATFIWLWGWAVYYILKYFNEKEIPGIHKPLGSGLAEQAGVKDQLDMITGEKEVPSFPANPEQTGDDENGEDQEKVSAGGGKEKGEKANGHGQGHGHGHGEKNQNGSANASPAAAQKKVGDAGKGVTDAGKGVTGKAQGAVGGVKGAVPAA